LALIALINSVDVYPVYVYPVTAIYVVLFIINLVLWEVIHVVLTDQMFKGLLSLYH